MHIFKDWGSRRQPKVSYVWLGLSESSKKPPKRARRRALADAEEPAREPEPQEQKEEAHHE